MNKYLVTLRGFPLVAEEIIATDVDQAKDIFKRKRRVSIADERLTAHKIEE